DLAHLRARRVPQCALRQELRPGQLDPDLRADAAHLFRRRVLLGDAAAAVGAAGVVRQSHPAHGERIPVRLPRRLRRQCRPRLRADAGRGGRAVRDRGRAHEPRCGNQGVKTAVALVSARAARGLDEDMPPLLAAFAAAGAHAEIADWDDPEADWARFDAALLRSAWDYTERLPELLDAHRAVLLQPYFEGVDQHGETALIYVNGRFSHAIRKGPLLPLGAPATDGLFAPETITRREPGADERAVADRTLAALPYGELLYARVDLIRDAAGKPCLLELELAEPSLFFAHEPRSAVQLAAATLARCAPAEAAAPSGKSTGR